MLGEGDTAPEFTLESEDGQAVTLDELIADGPLILYFYPADFTPVCTQEACSIRDMHDDISEAGFRVVGVSPQSASSHRRFKQRFDLPFTLLFDRGKRAIRDFGVNGPLGLGVRRATFVIDADKVIRGRVVSDLRVGNHTDFIRDAIARYQQS